MKERYDTEFKKWCSTKSTTKRKLKKLIRNKAKGLDIDLKLETDWLKPDVLVIASGNLSGDLGIFDRFIGSLDGA